MTIINHLSCIIIIFRFSLQACSENGEIEEGTEGSELSVTPMVFDTKIYIPFDRVKISDRPIKVERVLEEYSSTINSSQINLRIPNYLAGAILGSNLVLCVTCITFNAVIVSFYRSALKKIVPFIYFSNAFNDIIMGIGIALQSFLFIPNFGMNEEIIGFISMISYMIVGVSIRVSTFVNLVLCIVRGINIIDPFYQVRKFPVAFCIVLFVFIWICLSVWDVVWFHNKLGFGPTLYIIKTFALKPEVGFAALKEISGEKLRNFEDLLILFGPMFLVPVFILIASTAFQVSLTDYFISILSCIVCDHIIYTSYSILQFRWHCITFCFI